MQVKGILSDFVDVQSLYRPMDAGIVCKDHCQMNKNKPHENYHLQIVSYLLRKDICLTASMREANNIWCYGGR